jgi:clan AA aspartic protease
MGPVYSNFALRNPRKRELASVVIHALVDTGANTLCIPSALAAKLELEEVEKRGVTLADGSKRWVPYVGPVQLSFGKRHYPHALRAGLTGIAKTVARRREARRCSARSAPLGGPFGAGSHPAGHGSGHQRT